MEAARMFRLTVDGGWHQTEWYRTQRKLVEASTHMWNQTEHSGRRKKLVTCYGHVGSQSWHYPLVNVLSLVQKFWHQHDKGCGDSWGGHLQLDRSVQPCSGDGEFCSQSHCVPTSGIGGTVLCSDSRGCHVSPCDTICSVWALVQTLGTKGLQWHQCNRPY